MKILALILLFILSAHGFAQQSQNDTNDPIIGSFPSSGSMFIVREWQTLKFTISDNEHDIKVYRLDTGEDIVTVPVEWQNSMAGFYMRVLPLKGTYVIETGKECRIFKSDGTLPIYIRFP